MTDLKPASTTPDGQGDLGPPGATIAYCPLPDCPWATVTTPGPAEHPGALADVFGWGVFSATAAFDRLLRTERTIREHLETHDLVEWVTALTKAHDRIRELELTAEPAAASSDTPPAEPERVYSLTRTQLIDAIPASVAGPESAPVLADAILSQFTPAEPASLVLIWRDERGEESCRTSELRPGAVRIAIPLDANHADLVPYALPAVAVPDLASGTTDAPRLCESGCGCRYGTDDADRRECGCDGPCGGDDHDAWFGTTDAPADCPDHGPHPHDGTRCVHCMVCADRMRP